MSRQIMKELQYRAQLLLQPSSEEEDQINAYTASPAHSRPTPRIDLKTLIRSDDQDSDEQELSPNKPDIQLLKKCIALTNENNQLKTITHQQQSQIVHLQKLIEQLKQTAQDSKKPQKTEEVHKKSIEWEQSQLQNQIAGLRLENLQFKQQNKTLRSLNSQLQRELEQNKFKIARESPPSKEINMQNDYTIKFKNSAPPSDFPSLQQQYQARIKRVEGLLREEKNKNQKLCHFVNLEIPKLQNIIQELTLKLELKVDKYILRDGSHF